MADLFDKFQTMSELHARMVETAGVDPLEMVVERLDSPTEARIAGRACVMLGSNNYLGLTLDPEAVAEACQATRETGTGTTGSRVANGSYSAHKALERELADFYDMPHGIVFSTGYQANVGMLSALGGRGEYVLIDADCHASLYDGCKLGDAEIIRFRHNDPDNLDRRLKRLDPEAAKLVVVEGIYSMLGDLAPLAELVAVARAHGARVLVDEAHSLGVLGDKGRGLVETAGVEDQVDFIVGTFSKSLGTVGGYCVSPHRELEMMRFAARAYMFTASPTPAAVAAARRNLTHLRDDPELRARLWRNAAHLYDGLAELGYGVGPDRTPVIGVTAPDVETGLALWQALLEQEVYVNLALPPATPSGRCILRCSVSAAHSPEQIDTVLAAFAAAARRLGLGRVAAE